MQFRLRTLMIVLAVLAALVAIWFVSDSVLEMAAWSIIPILFALTYWRLSRQQKATRGYGYSGGDSGTGGESGGGF